MAVLHACVAAGRHEQAFEIFAQLKLGGFAARDATILLPLMAPPSTSASRAARASSSTVRWRRAVGRAPRC